MPDEYYNPNGLKLEGEAFDTLSSRIARGTEAVESDGAYDELETVASDVISNILTALFGPAGVTVCKPDPSDPRGVSYEIDYWEPVHEAAHAFLARAFDSWSGDAEDYDTEVIS